MMSGPWGNGSSGPGQKQSLAPHSATVSFKAPVVVRSRVHGLRVSANNSSDLEEWEQAGIPFHF